MCQQKREVQIAAETNSQNKPNQISRRNTQTYLVVGVVVAVALVIELCFRRHAAFEGGGVVELRPLDFADNREIVSAPEENDRKRFNGTRNGACIEREIRLCRYLWCKVAPFRDCGVATSFSSKT